MTSLGQLLRVEDDPAFVEALCPGTDLLAWPAMRVEFLRLMIGDQLYPSSPLADLRRRRQHAAIAGELVRSVIHNAVHPAPRADVLIVATGAGLVSDGGETVNRLTDHFARRLGRRGWTVESLVETSRPHLARRNHRLGYLALDRVKREVVGRVKPSAGHARVAGDLVAYAAERAKALFDWHIREDRAALLMRLGTRRLASYATEESQVRRLLEKVRPRLALVEEGCYGRMAVFNAVAKELGIHVAEFQHGMITQGHDAYNVAPELVESPAYARALPTSFLAYGAWWNDQFNAPVPSRHVVGNPHRTETLRSWRPNSDRSTVLVIGDGVETEAYLDLTRDISRRVPSHLKVVLRPHPRERHQLVSRDTRIQVDTESDIYRSLAGAVAVVGEASTVLFEAIGLVPRILALDTPKTRFYLGDHPFLSPATADGVAAMIGDDGITPASTTFVERFWSTDWQHRFSSFIEACL